MSSNVALAKIVLEETLAWGVRDFVICAGARNAPLVVPLLGAPETVKLWRHFDERAAAFFALGLAKREGRPVAVVTTSGTAVAELLPAVVEAHYSGIPLVLLTADRPKRFRATGAPQAIEQAHLFGAYSEGCFDVEAAEDFPVDFPWNRSRPIQVNPCFEEPEKEDPAEVDWDSALARGSAPFQPAIEPSSFPDPTLLERFLGDFAEGVVLLGEIASRDRPEVEAFLAKLGAPIWAEATSGLRESRLLVPHRLPAGEATFREWRPSRVLRIGGVPSLRFWRDLEDLPEIPVLSVTRTGFSGLARDSETTGWLSFQELDGVGKNDFGKQAYSVHAQGFEERFHEAELIGKLSEKIPEEALVFLGNSLPIREWNFAATVERPHPDAFANRGANGIDGELSTFLGLSEGREESWGIFGDLTTLYDATAPWMRDQLLPGLLRFVVINNGGGRIFSKLPAMADLDDAGKQITENRHQLDFSAWAALWEMEYLEISDLDGLDPQELGDHVVIELKITKPEDEAFWRNGGGTS